MLRTHKEPKQTEQTCLICLSDKQGGKENWLCHKWTVGSRCCSDHYRMVLNSWWE